MTRNGKIARLPKTVREELNRRIDNNELGKELVRWLNGLPNVQQVVAQEFNGNPIREQNLSEWKKGGFRDWQLLQERRELVQDLQENAEALDSALESKTINQHLSLVLAAELARTVRDLAGQSMDPQDRAQSLAKIIGRFAQLRREESNASRADLVQEQWEDELKKRNENKRVGGTYMPVQALLLQRMYIDTFSRPALRALHEFDAPSVTKDATALNPSESE
jgi:hypothetical protein